MEKNVQWVSRTEDLSTLVGSMEGERLAIDTEADSLHHYPEKVCLVQLSHAGTDYLVDPLDGVDLTVLSTVLGDPSVTKILHGADYDLRVLNRDFGLEVRGLFDTMVAARLVGEGSLGLAALLDQRFGVKLDKKFQRADWSRRPLPEAMARYAVLDTRHLEALADGLDAELRGLGRREWAAEEFRRLEDVRWSEPDTQGAFLKTKGASRLDRRGLAVLRALHRLRETEARRRNRPPFMVLRNETLMALAQTPPTRVATVATFPGMPRPWRQGRGAAELVATVGQALEAGEESWPEPPVRGRQRRSASFEARVKALAKDRDAVAKELGLEPSVVASRAALEGVVDALERGEEPLQAPGLRKWQAELLQGPLARLGA